MTLGALRFRDVALTGDDRPEELSVLRTNLARVMAPVVVGRRAARVDSMVVLGTE